MRGSTSRSRRAGPSTSPASTRASPASSTSRRRDRRRSSAIAGRTSSVLTTHDAVKIVICDRADYDWARAVLAKYSLAVSGVFLAELRGAAGWHARRLDSHGSLARALASAVAQSPMGQRAGALAMTRSVVLLSGGLDSATALALVRARGDECHTLAFDYGQRHRAELAAARRVSNALGAAAHREIRVSLGDIGGSALTDPRIAVPKHGGAGIPVTYVPARNTVFLSLGLALAEVVLADRIVIGVNAVDYSGYPDCRPEYIAAFQATGGARDQTRHRGRRGRNRCAAHHAVESRDHSPRPRVERRLFADGVVLSGRYARPRVRPLRLVPAAPGWFRRG